MANKKKGASKNAHTKLVSGPNTNGGKLWSHGPPPGSVVPGPGRPPSEIRKLFRGDLLQTREEIIRYLERQKPCKACGQRISLGELTRLADFLAKYSIGQAKGGMDPHLMHDLAQAVQEVTGASTEMMAELFQRWRRVIGTHVAGDAQ
jgi:hypothetical protein